MEQAPLGRSETTVPDPTLGDVKRLYGVAAVRGRSMEPTLRDGDLVVTRRDAVVRPGDVVVAEFLARAGHLVVKRAVRREDGGWWLEGDNAALTDDSRTYGA